MIEFPDADALHAYLLDLNYEQGIEPEVSGYDSLNRPVFAWLTEIGGDDTAPLAAYVGGPIVEQPDIVRAELAELSYPVRITTHPEARNQQGKSEGGTS